MSRLHPLRDLVARTGFSPRQIRFYITERLVPGAGDDRGPNAAYPQETLDRLLLIARLKSIPMPPANRTMTLEEIRRTLDGMTPQEIQRQAQDGLVGVSRMSPPASQAPLESFCLASSMLREEPADNRAEGHIRPLLHQTERLMTDLARHRAPWRHTPQDAWRCVKTPLLEIHVKEPVHDRERTQLRHLAASLSLLLGEEKP